jgi:hypothetical protein
MMPRVFLVWLVMASGIGWAVYQLKYEVIQLETQLNKLNRDIAGDQEAIRILKAEWSYLNQPQELETLSKRFLDLEPMLGRQFTDLASLPIKGGEPAPGGPRRVPAPPAPVAPAAKPPVMIEDEEPTGVPPEMVDEPMPAPAAPMLLVRTGATR